MNTYIPQLIILLLAGLSIGLGAARHGKPVEGKHNVGAPIIAWTIIILVLNWGGFFKL